MPFEPAPVMLPVEFAELQPFVNEWVLPSEEARFVKLHTVSLDHLKAFYHAMLPRMDAVLTYLNRFSLDTMPAEATLLFALAMTFAETAHPIDLQWQDVDFPDALSWKKFEFRTVSAQAH